MNCPNCKKQSRCGCKSCKSRVKYPSNRADKISNHPEHKDIGLITCPYCRETYSEEFLMNIDMGYPNFKVGDVFEFSFEIDHPSSLKGQTFKAEVGAVNRQKKEYGVYTDYGQDYISFDQALPLKNTDQ